MKNNSSKKPHHWESMTKKGKNLFRILPLIPHLIIVAVVVAIYYYTSTRGFFPAWQNYIYYATKVVIAFEIFAAAARTMLAPILALLAGIFFVIGNQFYDLNLLTTTDGWQLVIAALIGFFITLVIKL